MAFDSADIRSYFEHHFTYINGFDRNVARYRNQMAIIDPTSGSSWTYGELDTEVSELAAAFAAAGVGRGDRVVYQLHNTPQFVVIYLATQRIAAIDVPINYRLSSRETAFILEDSEPHVYVYSDAVSETAKAAVTAWGGQPTTVVVPVTEKSGDSPAGGESRTGTRPGDAVAAGAGPMTYREFLGTGAGRTVAPPEDFSTYEETTRLYTSGTTGMPKGVALPSIVEVMSAHDVMMHFPLGPTDRTLNMTPWFHRGGLYSGGPNPVFYAGASVVPMSAFDPDTALDWVDEYEITFLIGAPATLEAIANTQAARPRSLSTLKGIVTMGAPLNRDAALRYQQLLTPRIFNGYGTTETFWNTFLRPEDLPDYAGSAGRASTDDDVRVVKVFSDRRARPDETVAQDSLESGEVIMRSPKSGFRYVNLPEEQEEKFHDGWLYPGDIATWDEDGFVTILGRKDDMIISGGENVHPVQVEESLARHPGVADSAVVGISDPTWGQKIVAYVVPAAPLTTGVSDAANAPENAGTQDAADASASSVTARELDRHLLADDSLADYKRPRGYRFVESLPMTATGKKIHYEVARLAQEASDAGEIEFLGLRKD